MDRTSSRAGGPSMHHLAWKAGAWSFLLSYSALRGKVKPRPQSPIGVSRVEDPRRGSSNYLGFRASHNRRPLSTVLPRKGFAALVVRRRACRYARCGRVFYLCAHCDRGQVCCSKACGYYHRRSQCNKANRQYQGKFQGRLTHSLRQEAYRQRQASARAKKVTDQGLGKQNYFARLGITIAMMSSVRNETTSKGQTQGKNSPYVARCCLCGRWGFPSREGDRW
jgi:hypothetical protein